MTTGILAGLIWAFETLLLGLAMRMSPMVSTEQAVFLAPFVSTFLHDAASALWAALYNASRGQLKQVRQAFCSRSGRFVMLAAVIGGPIGMTGYVLAVNQLGASIGAVASAIYPATGSVLACMFLKEKMPISRWVFLLATMLGVYGLSYSPQLDVKNFYLGLLGAGMCAFGWGIEAVILAKSMQNPDVKDEYALQIRQTTSALIYGLILLPALDGWDFTLKLFIPQADWPIPMLLLAAGCATLSYLFYYRAISRIGASKAMALNVTYTAWAIVLTVLILKDYSVLSPMTIVCAAVVFLCSLLSAVNFRTLSGKSADC